jgi:dissimilatory sulfite reductase (desulfoviridin) alpha/beta subunit
MNMSSAQLNITNEEGEQEKLSELHTIAEKYGTSNTSLSERQKLLFDQLKSDDHIISRFTFYVFVSFF